VVDVRDDGEITYVAPRPEVLRRGGL
jgi:hypothetical protein